MPDIEISLEDLGGFLSTATSRMEVINVHGQDSEGWVHGGLRVIDGKILSMDDRLSVIWFNSLVKTENGLSSIGITLTLKDVKLYLKKIDRERKINGLLNG